MLVAVDARHLCILVHWGPQNDDILAFIFNLLFGVLYLKKRFPLSTIQLHSSKVQ